MNQSYEPLSICSVRKAILMLYLHKAEMVSKRDNKFCRSISLLLPLPSVIKLNKYIKVPYHIVELSKKNVLKRDNYQCQYCGGRSLELTIDHIVPKSRGGVDSWDNLVTACIRCNNKKGNRTPEEAAMILLNKPKKPNRILIMMRTVYYIDDTWKPFLFMD